MRLDLDRTPAGHSSLSVDGELELGLGDAGPDRVRLRGDLRVDNLEGRFVVRGALQAAGEVACHRCAREFALGFDVPVELVVLRDAGEETEDSDTPVLHQRDGVLDLTETLHEATVLAVPQVQLCREDCRGLCVRCGQDLNEGQCDCEDDEVDPRWDGLPD
jgi:uncharacterized protein